MTGYRIPGASPPIAHPTSYTTFKIPTNFYKVEDNHVFSSSLFASIFLNYQNPDYTIVPKSGLDAQYDYFDYQYQNSYPYYFAKDPQKQANLQVSKFFSTGKLNHELKFTFNYRQQIADSATGLPGDQIYGLYYSYSSAYAAVTGGVRTTYMTAVLDRDDRRYDHHRKPDPQRRPALRLSTGQEPSGLSARQQHGAGSRDPVRRFPRQPGMAVHVQEPAAPRLGHVRPRREEEHAAARPRTRPMPTSSASSSIS